MGCGNALRSNDLWCPACGRRRPAKRENIVGKLVLYVIALVAVMYMYVQLPKMIAGLAH